MTTLGYLILITALLLVVAAIFTIWTRLRSASQKDLRQDPGPISFEPSAISTAYEHEQEAEGDFPQDEGEIRLGVTGSADSAESGNSEYLDDLQDAAAGLARLMHSSHSNRVAVAMAEEDAGLVSGDRTEDVEQLDSVEDEAPVPEEIPEKDEEGVSHNQIEAVLGEEVVDQIEQIDSELDALEELVASIEQSLEAFSVLDSDTEAADGEALTIPEAA